MRKALILIVITIILINISCLNNKDKKKGLIIKETNVVLIGLIERGMDNKICIVTDYDSKSRISYYVKGKYMEELSKNIGSMVKIKGTVTEEKSPWTKEIIVEKIIEFIK